MICFGNTQEILPNFQHCLFLLICNNLLESPEITLRIQTNKLHVLSVPSGKTEIWRMKTPLGQKLFGRGKKQKQSRSEDHPPPPPPPREINCTKNLGLGLSTSKCSAAPLAQSSSQNFKSKCYIPHNVLSLTLSLTSVFLLFLSPLSACFVFSLLLPPPFISLFFGAR